MIEPATIQKGLDVYAIRQQFPDTEPGSKRQTIGLF